MKINRRRNLLKARYLSWSAGFTLMEALVGIAILTTTVAMSLQLSNSTNTGMRRSNRRAKTDSAIAHRLEEIRHCALFYKMKNSVKENPNEPDCRLLLLKYTEQLNYPDTTNANAFDAECSNNNMGSGFKTYLSNNATNITKSFNLQDYDNTADSIPITLTTNAVGNQLQISLVAESIPITVQSTIVPYALGWCQ